MTDEERIREIIREEITAYMTRMAETMVLDWSLVEAAGEETPQMKALMNEVAPIIGMHAKLEEETDD